MMTYRYLTDSRHFDICFQSRLHKKKQRVIPVFVGKLWGRVHKMTYSIIIRCCVIVSDLIIAINGYVYVEWETCNLIHVEIAWIFGGKSANHQ